MPEKESEWHYIKQYLILDSNTDALEFTADELAAEYEAEMALALDTGNSESRGLYGRFENFQLASKLARLGVGKLGVTGEEPLIFYDEIRNSLYEDLKEKIRAKESLTIEDVSKYGLRNITEDGLRTASENSNIRKENLLSLDEQIRNYLAEFGLEIDAPNTIVIEGFNAKYDGNDKPAGTYNFREDEISLHPRMQHGNVFTTWVHELQHKKNINLLLGERKEEIRHFTREGFGTNGKDENTADGYGSVLLDLLDVELSDSYSKMAEALVEKEVSWNFVSPNISTDSGRLEFERIFPNGEYLISLEFGEENSYELQFADPSELLSVQKESFDKLNPELRADAYEMIQKYGRKFEEAEIETNRVVSEYGLGNLEHRDEALAHFTGLQFQITDDGKPLIALNKAGKRFKSSLSGIREHYNLRKGYRQGAGNCIAEELLNWKETYDQLDGSPGERYSKIISNEALLEDYLKEGYIPSADELEGNIG